MDFTDNSAVAHAGRVTRNRDLVVAPSILRWAMEGKVFSAGLGPEDTAIDSEAAYNDLAHTFALIAPTSAAVYVLPIFVRMSMTGDGGAATYAQVEITKAAAQCATTMVTSGTALTTINHNSNIVTTPQSEALHTVTSTALTNADYITMIQITTVDALLTTGAPMANKENCFELDLLPEAWLLSAGAAMFLSPFTASTDSTWVPYIVWAELTADDIR